MTKEELEAVAEKMWIKFHDSWWQLEGNSEDVVEHVVHSLREHGWIVVSPSEQDEGKKQKWDGPPLDNEKVGIKR
jgi:hypothetical protein